jgi:hypothetical protein
MPISIKPTWGMMGIVKLGYKTDGCIKIKANKHRNASTPGNQAGIHKKAKASIIIYKIPIIRSVGIKSGNRSIVIGNNTILKT